ncbi:MAG: HD domain-containing protein [Firmicutes bacterium]|nr:HD domain-containing protein [Bacillota bacterium]
MKKLTYKMILENPEIRAHYEAIEDVQGHMAYHGWKHVNNTVENAKKLLPILNLDNEMQNAVLLALALHDIGKDFDEAGDKEKDHGYEGMLIARKMFEGFDVPHKEELLQAIKNHSKASDNTNSLLGAIVCFCDKLDITQKRVTPYGIEVGIWYGHVIDLRFEITGDYFIVNFICSKDFDKENFDADKWVLKMQACTENLANQLGKEWKFQFEQKEG